MRKHKKYMCHRKLIALGFKCHPSTFYYMYDKTYRSDKGCCENYYELRVFECDKFYDLIIASCPAAYAGDRTQWHGVNIGRATYKQIKAMDKLMVEILKEV